MESERQELRMPKFRGDPDKDFELWSLCLSAVLESKDLRGIVYEDRGPLSCQQGVALAFYESNVRKARAIFLLRL